MYTINLDIFKATRGLFDIFGVVLVYLTVFSCVAFKRYKIISCILICKHLYFMSLGSWKHSPRELYYIITVIQFLFFFYNTQLYSFIKLLSENQILPVIRF
jgi:hypothetical protein